MTLSHDEFRERMIDYLYGELTGEELRAFEAHLAASEEDRRELAAMQATLRSARQGLAQAADEPPARVRNAVLAAAQAQLRAAVPTRAETSSSIWSWLRSAWLMPSLAVVAAVTFVVLGKNHEAPRVPMEATAKGAPAPSLNAPPPSAAANEALRAPAVSAEPAVERESEPPATGALEPPSKAAQPTRAARREGGFAVPPPAWDAKRTKTASAERQRNEAPAPSPSAARKAESALTEDKVSGTLGRASPRPANAAAEPTDDLLDGRLPPPSAAAAPAARQSADSAYDARGSGAAATGPRAPDDLVRHATEHFAARRWQQAAADYRELLRRFPNDVRAVAWKKQLDSATQAQADADRAR